jgi:hypothetical protein
MSPEDLRAQLAAAQLAYIQLQTGAKGVSYSYTQGDGAKAVTYTAASPAGIMNLIRMLQAELGIICRARRAIGVRF